MRLLYFIAWYWRRFWLQREARALCDLYDRADCGGALMEFIRPDLAIRRERFNTRMTALMEFERVHLPKPEAAR